MKNDGTRTMLLITLYDEYHQWSTNVVIGRSTYAHKFTEFCNNLLQDVGGAYIEEVPYFIALDAIIERTEEDDERAEHYTKLFFEHQRATAS